MSNVPPVPPARRSVRPGLASIVLAGVVLAIGASLPALTASPEGASGGPTGDATATLGPPSTDVPGTSPSQAPVGAEPTPAGPQGGDATPEPTPSGLPSPAPCPPAPTGLAPAPVVSHGSRIQKVVALTFDDGWDPKVTAQILATLQRLRVNATFFPVGQAIEEDPQGWKRVAAAGFPIGDHTYDHRNLFGLCYASQRGEVARQSEIVSMLLGVTPLPVLRPPYGAFDKLTRVTATSAGQRDVVLWDVDTRDWSGLSASAIAARALAGIDGSIIVMHTFVANTALALPRIVAGYRARGFRFVTIGQLLGIPGPIPFR